MKQKLPYRYRIVIFIFFLALICNLDRIAFSAMAKRIETSFHLNEQQFGWVISIFALAYALFEIPSGILGDRIGQRSVLIRIVLWWSLFTAFTGLTTGLISLLIVRFLFGVGEAGAWPNGVASLSRWMPANEISRGQSWMGLGGGLGYAVTSIIVVPIAVAYGWRAPFFVIAMIGVVWVLFCFFWFRNNPYEMKNITIEERKYIESNRKIQTHQHRLSWKLVLKNKNMWALALAYFCGMAGWSFYVYWLPLYLQDGLHFSENEMKSVTFFVYIAGALGAFIMGFVSDWLVKKRGLKFGRRSVGTTVLSIGAVMFFCMGITTSLTLSVFCLVAGYFFIYSNTVPAFSTCIDIGDNKVGSVAGIMNTIGQTSAVLLGLVVGSLSNIRHNYTSSLFVLAVVLISGGLLWLLVDPTKKLTEEQGIKIEAVVAA